MTPTDGGIDMGTQLDLFDEALRTLSAPTEAMAAGTRAILLEIMELSKMNNEPEEWSHFRLRDEPL